MPLPSNFAPVEHLQSTILRIQNKIIAEEFRDVGDDEWQLDISTNRASLRTACTCLGNDSLSMTLARLWLFYGVMRKAQDFHPAIFGIPAMTFAETTKYFPQIQLHFLEKYEDVDEGYDQLKAQISFRLVNETSTSISKTDLTTIGNKIKQLFWTGTPFNFKKGRQLATYIDQAKGYYFQLYVFDTAQAKKVIEQVLDIQSHTPDWKLLNIHTNEEPAQAYPTIPPQKTILGKPHKQPRIRPAGTVHFRYAIAQIHGIPRPVVLYDPLKNYKNALVN